MTRREEQAFNDGKNACRIGQSIASCTRKSCAQRAAWMLGYEEQRRFQTAEKATDAERTEARDVLAKLKNAVRNL